MHKVQICNIALLHYKSILDNYDGKVGIVILHFNSQLLVSSADIEK